MSDDVHDYTQPDPRCSCRTVHGNADTDGICKFCRPKVEAALEAREAAVGAAFARLAEQAHGLRDHELDRLVSATLRSVHEHGRCRLCLTFDGCLPNCAATLLLELIS